MQSAKDGTSCAPNSDLGADEIVSKVLLCRHSFQVFGLDPPRVIELPDLQRLYRQLALRLHPDKNPSEAAQSAFIRLADAFEELKDPVRQKTLLLRLHRAKGGKTPSKTYEGHGARKGAAEEAAPAPAREGGSRQRSFMDVMREWEEFEKEYESTVCVEDELQRQIRQERKRSRQADRAQREQVERAALESVLEEDLEERSSSWNSFLTGKGKARKKKSTLSAPGEGTEPEGVGGSGGAYSSTVVDSVSDSASRPKVGRWGALDSSLPPRLPSYATSDT